jgi:hypothetical protein
MVYPIQLRQHFCNFVLQKELGMDGLPPPPLTPTPTP